MPLPTPQPNETHNSFITRCMHIIANDDRYKSNKQRVAVCESIWARSKKKNG
jgi:hypothetical protein